MVSDFGMTRYCDVCRKEIVRKGDVATNYKGKEVCECDKEYKAKNHSPRNRKRLGNRTH